MDITRFTIPPARNPHSYYALQYNGDYWTEAGHSPLLQETFNPFEDTQLINGQVYFYWNNEDTRFEVVQRNGPGGLMVDGAMAQVPNEGIWLQSRDSATTSSALNYFYLRRPDSDHIPTVSGAIGTEDSGTSGPIELTLSTLNGADTGDQIWLKCHSILGTYEANGIWTATVIDSTHVELIGSSFSNSFDVSPDSQCMSVQLAATEEDHVTSTSGVEIQDDDVHATLVGMCYVGASHTINDTSEKRDCASWYNRGIKTCVKSFASDHTTTSTSYTELSSEIECEFVTWGKGDPVGTEDLQWSISGMVKNNTGGDGAALSVRFDAMTPVEPQETGMINSIVATNGLPFSDSGSKSDLTEGKHYATLVGKAITGGTVTVFGNTAPAASLTVRIPQ